MLALVENKLLYCSDVWVEDTLFPQFINISSNIAFHRSKDRAKTICQTTDFTSQFSCTKCDSVHQKLEQISLPHQEIVSQEYRSRK